MQSHGVVYMSRGARVKSQESEIHATINLLVIHDDSDMDDSDLDPISSDHDLDPDGVNNDGLLEGLLLRQVVAEEADSSDEEDAGPGTVDQDGVDAEFVEDVEAVLADQGTADVVGHGAQHDEDMPSPADAPSAEAPIDIVAENLQKPGVPDQLHSQVASTEFPSDEEGLDEEAALNKELFFTSNGGGATVVHRDPAVDECIDILKTTLVRDDLEYLREDGNLAEKNHFLALRPDITCQEAGFFSANMARREKEIEDDPTFQGALELGEEEEEQEMSDEDEGPVSPDLAEEGRPSIGGFDDDEAVSGEVEEIVFEAFSKAADKTVVDGDIEAFLKSYLAGDGDHEERLSKNQDSVADKHEDDSDEKAGAENFAGLIAIEQSENEFTDDDSAEGDDHSVTADIMDESAEEEEVSPRELDSVDREELSAPLTKFAEELAIADVLPGHRQLRPVVEDSALSSFEETAFDEEFLAQTLEGFAPQSRADETKQEPYDSGGKHSSSDIERLLATALPASHRQCERLPMPDRIGIIEFDKDAKALDGKFGRKCDELMSIQHEATKSRDRHVTHLHHYNVAMILGAGFDPKTGMPFMGGRGNSQDEENGVPSLVRGNVDEFSLDQGTGCQSFFFCHAEW